MTTTLPTNSSGDGATGPTSVWYTRYGQVQWSEDALGYVNYTAYDNGTGAVVDSIVDADPSLGTGTRPTRGTGLPRPLALGTDTISLDDLGRPLQVSDPKGNITQYSYTHSATEEAVTVTPPTVASGPSAPAQVTDYNYALGQESISTTNGGTAQSLTVNKFDNAWRLIESDSYYQPTQFYVTSYTYNVAGRQSTVVDPLGTITTTDYDALGRVIDKRIAGVVVERDVYDNGQVGDSDLTQVADIPGFGSLNKRLPDRVTTNYYNWQDELLATDNRVALTYDTLNNAGEVTQADVFADANAGLSFLGTDGFVNGTPTRPTNPAALVQRTLYAYDDEGRLYQTTQVGVVPIAQTYNNVAYNAGDLLDTGTEELASNTYYDADGQVVATSSPTGLWTKTTYDGAGRVTGTYATDNFGGDPANVSDDNVFSQTEVAYDADGNGILTVATDWTISPTAGLTGQVSSVKNVYDADDRVTETDNFGSNTVPSSGTTGALVTRVYYNTAGQVGDTVDAMGVWTDYTRDMLGRVTKERDAYNNNFADSYSSSVNKTTTYQYNGDNEVTQMVAEDVAPAVGGRTPRRFRRSPRTYMAARGSTTASSRG